MLHACCAALSCAPVDIYGENELVVLYQIGASAIDQKPEKKPARIGKRYSNSIGCVVKTVQGTEAAYTLASDDLYVRARITSTQRPAIRASNEPEFTTAWTQPCLPSKGWF